MVGGSDSGARVVFTQFMRTIPLPNGSAFERANQQRLASNERESSNADRSGVHSANGFSGNNGSHSGSFTSANPNGASFNSSNHSSSFSEFSNNDSSGFSNPYLRKADLSAAPMETESKGFPSSSSSSNASSGNSSDNSFSNSSSNVSKSSDVNSWLTDESQPSLYARVGVELKQHCEFSSSSSSASAKDSADPDSPNSNANSSASPSANGANSANSASSDSSLVNSATLAAVPESSLSPLHKFGSAWSLLHIAVSCSSRC